MDNLHKIQSIIEKWETIANRTNVSCIADEIEQFFIEIIESKIDKTDVLKFKERILRIWVDLTWSDAKKNNPNWKEKDWWQTRKNLVIKFFGENYKAMIQQDKAVPAKTEEAFENVEDLIAWAEKNKRRANS